MCLRRVPFSLESLLLALVLALVLASLVKSKPKSLIYTPKAKRDHEHPQPFKKGRLPGRERGDNREVKHDVNGRRQTAKTTSEFQFFSSNP